MSIHAQNPRENSGMIVPPRESRDTAPEQESVTRKNLSEENLHFAIDGTSDGLWYWDIPSGDEWWSARFRDLLGYSEAELPASYESWKSLLHPDEQDGVLQLVERHIEKGEPYSVEYRLLTKEHGYRWFHARGRSENGDDGRPVRMGGSIQDITDLKLARDEQRESARLFHDLYDNAPDMFASIDATTGAIVECNNTLAEATGYSKEEIIGFQISMLYHPDSQAVRQRVFQTFVEGGDVHDVELKLQRKDGGTIDVSLSISAIRNNEGKVVRSRSVWRDITQRKRAEEALEESEANFAKAQRIARIGSWNWDIAANKISWSDEYFRIVGITRQAFEANYDAYTKCIHPDDLELFKNTTERVLKEKKPYSFEYRIVRPDGEIRVIQEQGEVTVDTNANPVNIFGTAQDITERRRAEESVARFSCVLDDSLSEIYFFDADSLRFTQVNRGARLNLGYTADELKSLTPLDLKPEFTAESFAELVQPLRDGAKENIKFEAVHRRKDGTHYPVEVHLQISMEPTPLFVAIILDITKRKQALEALTEREKHFRLFSLSTGDSFWNWDMIADTIERSSGFDRAFGYQAKQIDSSIDWWTDRIHPEDKDRVLKTFVEAVAGMQSTVRYEYRFRREDDSYAIVEDHVCLVRDAAGKVVRSLGAMHDISDQRQAEADKEEYFARSIGVVKSSVDSIITIDDVGVIESVNPAGETLFGYEEAELIGQNVKILMPEPYRGNHDGYLDAYRATGVKRIIDGAREVEARRKDGTTFPMRLSVSEIKFGARRIFAGIIHDLTHELELEKQLLQTQKLESLGTLAAGIAHDLNNVLAPILMAIAPLRASLKGEHADEILDTVQICAERGSDIIRQVLTFARESKGTSEQCSPVSIAMEIRGILSKTFPKSIRLHWEIEEDVSSVLADPTHLQQMLLNLCLNARDSMPEGGDLLVRAENTVIDENMASKHLDAQPGDFVLFHVKDTGQGMSRDLLTKIFDPFFTTKELGKGSGLGLSTVSSIVIGLGGFVDVTSEIGQGTEFKIYIPAAGTTVADSIREEVATPKFGGGQVVLVVDDEASIRKLARVILEAGGYQVLTACDGEEGKEMFDAFQGEIDLLLTDIMMPRMDGGALIRATRAVRTDLKVVAISGLDDEISVKSGIVANETIAKPFDARELLRVVGRVLSKS